MNEPLHTLGEHLWDLGSLCIVFALIILVYFVLPRVLR